MVHPSGVTTDNNGEDSRHYSATSGSRGAINPLTTSITNHQTSFVRIIFGGFRTYKSNMWADKSDFWVNKYNKQP